MAESTSKKTLSCADAGHPECDWRATGRDEEDVMRQAEHHARSAHREQDLSEEQKRKMRAHIRAA